MIGHSGFIKQDKMLSYRNKVINYGLGFNFIIWGIIGLVEALYGFQMTVRIFISLINITVGIFFVIRHNTHVWASFKNGNAWVAVLFLNILVFQNSLPLSLWPEYSKVLFVLGALFTLISIFRLGRNFGIVPSIRKIEVDGVYRFIRHPIYTGELVMVLACTLVTTNFLTWAVTILFLIFLVRRIDEEEQILNSDPVYRDYLQHVKWRLIPFVW